MPNPIDANDKLAIAVGRATSTWAHAEVHLTTVFAILTGMDHTMAATVFRFFRNVPTHKDALLQVARVSTRCDEQDFAALSAILTDYSSLAGRRNSVVHNPFGWVPGEEQKIYRMQKEKVSKPGMFPYSRAPVDVAEIEALTAEIKATVDRIVLFGAELSEKLLKAARFPPLDDLAPAEEPKPPPRPRRLLADD
jgi:hypothetical protein